MSEGGDLSADERAKMPTQAIDLDTIVQSGAFRQSLKGTPRKQRNEQGRDLKDLLEHTLEQAVDSTGSSYYRVKGMPYGLDIEVGIEDNSFIGSGAQSIVIKGKIRKNVAAYLYSYVQLRGHEKAEDIDILSRHIGGTKNTRDYKAIKQALDNLGTRLNDIENPVKRAQSAEEGEVAIMETEEFQRIAEFVHRRIGDFSSKEFYTFTEDDERKKVRNSFRNGECAVKLYKMEGDESEAMAKREGGVIPGLRHRGLDYMLAQGEIPNGDGPTKYFSALELVKTLSKKDETGMDYADRIGIGIQVLKCLREALWSKRIIHRDIKPQNLLMYRDKENKKRNGNPRVGVKVTDTGAIKTIREFEQTFESSNIKGTLIYIAPEYMRARSPTGRGKVKFSWTFDFYSTGATLYEYMTGLLPTENGRIPDAFEHYSSLQSGTFRLIRPSATEHLNKILEDAFGKRSRKLAENVDLVLAGMLQNKPQDRYKSASQCIKDLESLMEGNDPTNILQYLRAEGISKEQYLEGVFKPKEQEGFLRRHWRKFALGAAGAAVVGGLYVADPEGTEQTVRDYIRGVTEIFSSK